MPPETRQPCKQDLARIPSLADPPFRWIWVNQRGVVFRSELFWVQTQHLAFLACVPLLWFWIGNELRARATTQSHTFTLFRFGLGLAVGGLCAWYALDLLVNSSYHGFRVVGVFGLVWASILISYFGWKSATHLGWAKAGTRAER